VRLWREAHDPEPRIYNQLLRPHDPEIEKINGHLVPQFTRPVPVTEPVDLDVALDRRLPVTDRLLNRDVDGLLMYFAGVGVVKGLVDNPEVRCARDVGPEGEPDHPAGAARSHAVVGERTEPGLEPNGREAGGYQKLRPRCNLCIYAASNIS